MKQLSVVGTLCAAMAGLLGSGSAQATLVDRGGGMLYDTVLNVTWLQDANYAATSEYCETLGNCHPMGGPTGRMTWLQANTWANNLNYGGYSDWRLPHMRARNGVSWISPVTGGSSESFWNGQGDIGYNMSPPTNELAVMHYVHLGAKGFLSPLTGERQPDFGVGPYDQEVDIAPVKNLVSMLYWTGGNFCDPVGNAPCETFDNSLGPLAFDFYSGNQGAPYPNNALLLAWAVRDGDVAAIPLPGSVALLAGGLALLGLVSRRRSAR